MLTAVRGEKRSRTAPILLDRQPARGPAAGRLRADVRLRAGLDASPARARTGSRGGSARSWAGLRKGQRTATIAEALFISPKTVSVHVSALLRKFGVSGRGDLHSVAAAKVHRE
jgi:hypothetical protein